MQEEQLVILWEITRACNFSCKYCQIRSAVAGVKSAIAIQRLCKILKETGKKCTVTLTGGEPFLHPNFVALCKELTKEFQIIINTNLSLSSKLKEFVNNIDVNKVRFILASAHVEEREKKNNLEDFIMNVLLLKEKGFDVRVNYVLYPALIRRLGKDYEYFNSRGIKLLVKPFQGWYKGKRYPGAYSNSQKNLILKYYPSVYFYPFCFKGIRCNAGKTYIRIDEDGIVTRCSSDSSVLGDLFGSIKLNDNAEPCKVYRCSCVGYDLIEEKPCPNNKSNFNLLYDILATAFYFKHKKGYLWCLISSVLKSFRR